jgi:periplasmic nitrate reductase NapE
LSERKQSVSRWPRQAGSNTVARVFHAIFTPFSRFPQCPLTLILRKAGYPLFVTLLLKSNINNPRPNPPRTHTRRETMVSPPEIVPAENRSRETRVFVFLTVVLAPLLAVAIVGSYGLLIWLYQMLMGPPKG